MRCLHLQLVRVEIMATSQQIMMALSGLQGLSQQIGTCEQVARALIETGEVWCRDGPLSAWLLPTDYERARRQVMQACTRLVRQIRMVRRTSLSPDAIRAQDYVAKIRACCACCPEANAQRAGSGGFRCMVQERLKGKADKGLRRYCKTFKIRSG